MSQPAKSKLAYFKDNIATDEDDFDASQYYYNRHGSAGGSPSDGSTMSAMGDAGLIGGGFGSGGTFGAGGMPSGGFFGSSGGGPSGSGGAPGLGSSPGSVGLGAMGPGGVGTGMPGALQRRSTSTSAGLEGGAYGGSIPNPGAGSLHRASSVPLGYGSGLPNDPSSLSSSGSSGAAGDLFAVLNKAGAPGLSNSASNPSSLSMMSNAPDALSMGAPGPHHSSIMSNGSLSQNGGNGGMGEAPFNINEFPALGGAPGRAPGGSGSGGASSSGGGSGAGGAMSNSGGGGSFGGFGREHGVGMSLSHHGRDLGPLVHDQDAFPALGMGAGGPGGPRAPSSGGSGSGASDHTSGMSSAGGSDDTQQYGLLGLLSVVRMTDPDLNTLALGSDLTTLGLNLNSAKSLYATFASPWAEQPSAQTEPQFTLPTCYVMAAPPPLKHAHLQKFQLETLFHIFYAMPKDLLQAYAAAELYGREWRYHSELKLWFRRANQQDLPHLHADRAAAQFVFFDLNSWECRLFSGNAHVVSSGLMSEEEVRIRPPPAP